MSDEKDQDELMLVPIEEMTKDQLELFAKQKHGKDLDKRRKLEELQKEVLALEGGETRSAETVAAGSRATHLRHPVNGRLFEATDLLRKRGDMIPCNADGKAV